MTEADFNSIKGPLTDSLSLTNKHPFENGAFIHLTKLDDYKSPDNVVLSGTIHREPIASTSSSFARLNDLVMNDDNKVVAKETSAVSSEALLRVIHPECKGVTAEQSTMTALEELSLESDQPIEA